MADTNTTNYSLVKPEVGASEDTWGNKLNQNLDTLDSKIDDIEGKSGEAVLKHTNVDKFKTTTFGAEALGILKMKSGREEVYSLTGTAIDPANGAIQHKTMTANTTFTESLSDGDSVVLRLDGSYTVTWPTMTWITSGGNVAPTLNGTKDTIVLWQENSTVYGAYVGYGA